MELQKHVTLKRTKLLKQPNIKRTKSFFYNIHFSCNWNRLLQLPNEVQKKVSTYMANKRKPLDERKPQHTEMKSIKVPIPTFPPTAMAYSLPKSPNSTRKSDAVETEATPEIDIVSAAIMAKVLEEREKERANMKHCETCTCSQRNNIHISNNTHDAGSQTNDVNVTQCYKYETALEQNQIVNVKRTESRGKSTYVHDYDNHNIAMVEPNNFLSENNKLQNLATPNLAERRNDNKFDHVPSKTQRNNQEKLNVVPKNQVVNYVQVGNVSEMDFFTSNNGKLECSILDRNINTRKNIPHKQQNIESTNLDTRNYQIIAPRHVDPNICHRTSNLMNFAIQNVAKPATDSAKEFCSKHSQTSSRNLLLDNLHDAFKACETNEHRITTIVKDSSTNTNTRVSEWIDNSVDVNVSDNSQCESSRSVTTSGDDSIQTIDKEKYVEMENNVKRFLFGESGFLRTVEIDKDKYHGRKKNKTHSNKCKGDKSSGKNNSM